MSHGLFHRHHHKHKNWFPVIVVALTLALLAAIVSLFGDRFGSTDQAISATQYQSQVIAAATDLPVLAEASDDSEALITAREELLTVIVPELYKEAHLEMVLVLTRWINAINLGDVDAAATAMGDWQELTSSYDWLQ